VVVWVEEEEEEKEEEEEEQEGEFERIWTVDVVDMGVR
jgi:hypothetical protein